MLYQLCYEVKSVRVGDISEQSLVPSISIVCLVNLYTGRCKQREAARQPHAKRALTSEPHFLWVAMFAKILVYGYLITSGFHMS